MIYCINHGARPADFHCAQCQVGYCRDCVSLKDFGSAKIDICPRCKNGVTDLGPYKPIAPFWTRIPDIITFPLQGDGYMTMLGWAVFATVFLFIISFSFMNFFTVIGGFFFLILYMSLLVSYFWRIIARSEDGKFDVPDFAEFEGVLESLVGPMFQFAVASLAAFLPLPIFLLIITNLHGGLAAAFTSPLSIVYIILIVVFYLVGLALIPMAFLVMGVFRRYMLVFNYWFLIQQVLKIPAEYLILLIFLVALSLLQLLAAGMITLLLSVMGTLAGGLLSYPIFGMIHLYSFMVLGHLLGYLAYQTRFKLKWWPENQEEPVFMVGGQPVKLTYQRARASYPSGARAQPAAAVGAAAMGAAAMGAAIGAGAGPAPGAPAPASPAPGAFAPPGPAAAVAAGAGMEADLARQIDEGMSMIEHGRHQEARELFQEILAQNPRHLAALRGMAVASIKQGDLEAAKVYAQKQGAELFRLQSFEALWEVYSETRKGAPDFTLGAKEQIGLSRWLIKQERAMEAARLLREFAVANPDYPLSPKALYQCGEILWKRCGKPENAAQMFDYILKRYPEVVFADQIKHALSQLKSG